MKEYFDYGIANVEEYEKLLPIKKLELWENIPAQYIKKYMEYDYQIKKINSIKENL